jgi:hypothetical protein
MNLILGFGFVLGIPRPQFIEGSNMVKLKLPIRSPVESCFIISGSIFRRHLREASKAFQSQPDSKQISVALAG